MSVFARWAVARDAFAMGRLGLGYRLRPTPIVPSRKRGRATQPVAQRTGRSYASCSTSATALGGLHFMFLGGFRTPRRIHFSSTGLGLTSSGTGTASHHGSNTGSWRLRRRGWYRHSIS